MNQQELIKREIERRERYLARMREVFYKQLEKQNIKLINDVGHRITLEYNGVRIYLLSNQDWNSLNNHWRVQIDDKTLATRCNIDTALFKAKRYIESEMNK